MFAVDPREGVERGLAGTAGRRPGVQQRGEADVFVGDHRMAGHEPPVEPLARVVSSGHGTRIAASTRSSTRRSPL